MVKIWPKNPIGPKIVLRIIRIIRIIKIIKIIRII